MSSKVKSCLLCENYKTHHSECEHCEDWDNFRISEDGKALREKIYGDGYQDGHRDGYDKGYDDAQKPQGKWIRYRDNPHQPEHIKCSNCGQYWSVADHDKIFDICFKCGAYMRGGRNES